MSSLSCIPSSLASTPIAENVKAVVSHVSVIREGLDSQNQVHLLRLLICYERESKNMMHVAVHGKQD